MSSGKHLEGKTLSGRYELVRWIDGGGFGDVFEARDLKLDGRRRAVKVVHPEYAGQIRREAIVGQVESRNVVAYLDYEHDGPLAYLVMEYLNGRTLDKLGELSHERLCRLVREAGGALQKAHDANLVHRDLKPKNIILVDEGTDAERFVILDFGIASQVNAGSHTRRGATMDSAGTPEYMSPEQMDGVKPCPQSDIYSFGVILYSLLTGRVPFPFESESWSMAQVARYVQSVKAGSPPPFREACPGRTFSTAARNVEGLVLRCLTKAPENRPASMKELVEEFLAGYRMGLEDAPASSPASHQSSRDASAVGNAESALVRSRSERPQLDAAPERPSAGESVSAWEEPQLVEPRVAPNPSAKTSGRRNPLAHGQTAQPPGLRDGGTLLPGAGGETDQGTLSNLKGAFDTRGPMRRRSPEPRPSRRPMTLALGLGVLILVLCAGVLYPLIRGNRLQAEVGRLVQDGRYGEAVAAVQTIDPITSLWTGESSIQTGIRRRGVERARGYLEQGMLKEAVDESQRLLDAFAEDAESLDVMKSVADRLSRQAVERAQRGAFADAVEFYRGHPAVRLALPLRPDWFDPERVKREVQAVGLQQMREHVELKAYQLALDAGQALRKLDDSEELSELMRSAAFELHLDKADEQSASGGPAFEELELAARHAKPGEDDARVRLKRAGFHNAVASAAVEQDDDNAALDHYARALSDLNLVVQTADAAPRLTDMAAAARTTQANVHFRRGEVLHRQHQELTESGESASAHAAILQATCDYLACIQLAPAHSDGVRRLTELTSRFELVADEATEAAEGASEEAARALQDGTELTAEQRDAIDEHWGATIRACDVLILCGTAGSNSGKSPWLPLYLRGLARSQLSRPDYAGAIHDLEAALADPQFEAAVANPRFDAVAMRLMALSRLAWMLATAPDEVAHLRDGVRAVAHADRAEELLPDPQARDEAWITCRKSRVAAYAERGDFMKALALANAARADFDPGTRARQDFDTLRTCCEERRPYREPWLGPPDVLPPAPCSDRDAEVR